MPSSVAFLVSAARPDPPEAPDSPASRDLPEEAARPEPTAPPDDTSGGGVPTSKARAATFESIYDENVDFAWRSARRLGVSEAFAEDVLQQVFLVVHRRLPEFEHRSSY